MFFADYKAHQGTNLSPTLLWEYDLQGFDYMQQIRLVVQRVIERGLMKDFYAMVNLYGLDSVIRTIKELPYLSKRNMNFASIIFEIPLTQMKCSKPHVWRQQHWDL